MDLIPIPNQDIKSLVGDYDDPEWATNRHGFGSTTPSFLAGRLTNPLLLLVLGVTLILVSWSLFIIANIASGDPIKLFEKPSGGGPRAAWLFGCLALVAGLVYLFLSAVAKGAKAKALYEDDFRTEPRDYDGIGISGATHYHEVIKVRCRYCGTLNEVATSNCIACGGVL
jgi:hypothetical protein